MNHQLIVKISFRLIFLDSADNQKLFDLLFDHSRITIKNNIFEYNLAIVSNCLYIQGAARVNLTNN